MTNEVKIDEVMTDVMDMITNDLGPIMAERWWDKWKERGDTMEYDPLLFTHVLGKSTEQFICAVAGNYGSLMWKEAADIINCVTAIVLLKTKWGDDKNGKSL